MWPPEHSRDTPQPLGKLSQKTPQTDTILIKLPGKRNFQPIEVLILQIDSCKLMLVVDSGGRRIRSILGILQETGELIGSHRGIVPKGISLFRGDTVYTAQAHSTPFTVSSVHSTNQHS